MRVLGEIEFKWGNRFLIEEVLEQTRTYIRVRGHRAQYLSPTRRLLKEHGEWTFTWRTIDEIKWRDVVFIRISGCDRVVVAEAELA